MTKSFCSTTEEFHHDWKKMKEFFLKHLCTIKLPTEYFDADSVGNCTYPYRRSLRVAKFGLEMSTRGGSGTLDIISARSKITIKKDKKVVFSCPATIHLIVIIPIDQIDKVKREKLIQFLHASREVALLSYQQNEDIIIWSCSNIEEYEKQLVKSGVKLPNMSILPLWLIGSEPVQVSDIDKWFECQPAWTPAWRKQATKYDEQIV